MLRAHPRFWLSRPEVGSNMSSMWSQRTARAETHCSKFSLLRVWTTPSSLESAGNLLEVHVLEPWPFKAHWIQICILNTSQTLICLTTTWGPWWNSGSDSHLVLLNANSEICSWAQKFLSMMTTDFSSNLELIRHFQWLLTFCLTLTFMLHFCKAGRQGTISSALAVPFYKLEADVQSHKITSCSGLNVWYVVKLQLHFWHQIPDCTDSGNQPPWSFASWMADYHTQWRQKMISLWLV